MVIFLQSKRDYVKVVFKLYELKTTSMWLVRCKFSNSVAFKENKNAKYYTRMKLFNTEFEPACLLEIPATDN